MGPASCGDGCGARVRDYEASDRDEILAWALPVLHGAARKGDREYRETIRSNTTRPPSLHLASSRYMYEIEMPLRVTCFSTLRAINIYPY